MKTANTTFVRWGFVAVMAVLLACGPVMQAQGADIDYLGTYAGTFAGDDQGYWVAVINATPFPDGVFLSYSTQSGSGDGGFLNFESEVIPIGRYTSTSVMHASGIAADIDSSSGEVTGTWENINEAGTFSGGRITSCPPEGAYSGQILGDASGTWTMAIAEDCYITGSATVEGDTLEFKGGAHPDGYVIAFGVDGHDDHFAFFGQVSDDGISGFWESEAGESGTFGPRISVGDDGGSGGGCFISHLPAN
jgi:hypothetical protein